MATPIGNGSFQARKPQRDNMPTLPISNKMRRTPSAIQMDSEESPSPSIVADRQDTESPRGWSNLLRVRTQTPTPASSKFNNDKDGLSRPKHRSLRNHLPTENEEDLPAPSELLSRSESDFVPYYEPPGFSEEPPVTYASDDDDDRPMSPFRTTSQPITRTDEFNIFKASDPTITRAADPTITSAQAEGSGFPTVTPPLDRPGRQRPLPNEPQLDTVIPAAAAVEAFKRAVGGSRSRAPFRSPNDTNHGDDDGDDGNGDMEHEEPIPLVQRKDKQPVKPMGGRNMSTMKAIAATGASPAATGTGAGTTEAMAAEERSNLPPDKKNRRARRNWSIASTKTKAVVSANAFMDTGTRRRELQPIASSHTLVPFFAPAISVPYFWMARDEKNRRSPPVIMDALSLAITDSDIEVRQLYQHWIFRVELEYGDTKWVIRRTFLDFYNLHATLLVKARVSFGQLPPTFPNQIYWFYYTVISKMRSGDERDERRGRMAAERRKALEDWLVALIKQNNMRVNYDLCEFLEISAISITRDMGWKGKEGYLEAKIDFLAPTICQLFRIGTWSTEWVMLRDSYVAFCSNIGSINPTDVFLFDKTFLVTRISPHFLAPGSRHHLTIQNKHRRIDMKGSTNRTIDDWMESLKLVQESSPWLRVHRFDSFAPVREQAKVKWYVDGKDYFHAISEAILAAKSEIYISDWWLSPEIYLRRPASQYSEFRLDRLLQRKAEEGVMIYVMVYKEMTYALTLNSVHTKTWLQELHKNIIEKFLEDDNTFELRMSTYASLVNPEMFGSAKASRSRGKRAWFNRRVIFDVSVLKKMFIVDYRLAFIGGLDLCFGRYDSHNHKLCDNHIGPGSHDKEVWPGQDYSNPRIKDFANVEHHEQPLINKDNTPRIPWHDVAIGMVGTPARDIARHFVQRWNFIKATKGMHRVIVPFLTPKGEFVATRDDSKFKGTCRVQVIRSSAEWSSGVDREHSIYNAYVECILNALHFIYIENQFFVTSQNDERNVIKNKIGQAIVERIKRAHKEGRKFRVIVVMPLAPGFEGDFASSDSGTMRMVMHWQYVSISRGGHSVVEKLRAEGINSDDYISFFSLRSHDKFDGPVSEQSPTKESELPSTKESEQSLTNASEQSPTKEPEQSPIKVSSSMHNRFLERENLDPLSPVDTFVGSPSKAVPTEDRVRGEDIVTSPLAQTVTEKASHSSLESKPKNQSQTSVPDTIETTTSADGESTIVRKRGAHKAKESATTVAPTDGRELYVTEELYIHSKLLIVDDRIVICGSANLNDRSQLGNRDSEIAMIIEDEDTIRTRMNGKPYLAARFAHTLRCQLFKEHLGLLNEEEEEPLATNGEQVVTAEQLDSLSNRAKGRNISVTAVLSNRTPTPTTFDRSPEDPLSPEDRIVRDPLSDDFYKNTWLQTAQVNTQVFRDVFRCVPDDTVTTFDEYRSFVPDPKIPIGHVANPEMSALEIQQKLDLVKGHLVVFPTEFLKKENLIGSVLKEAVVPMEIFT
ncbi:hypothetical protein BC937DRAFT_90093 [Endogone sp. FLAS-F59071]|nr:hypothetical protein BC937DRAFT_90093 [Endogone sp. FLAS-F59071]|eukprot:RUS17342.1 hypothetical protein BC937DRAFT_90093 [Endogone sp. FLAS-F59071]